jgi:membrane protease YdiL (CAAX protease family)
MRLPVDLWPQQANRPRFSFPAALLTSFVLGALIVLAKTTEIPRIFWENERIALGVVVLGGAVVAVGWGRTRQAPYARWYAIAALCAVLPVALGMLGLAVRGEVQGFDVSIFVKSVGFLGFFSAAGALVTQEVAFRRLLVGQSGDAGLLVVLVSALVFGAWHAVIPHDGALIPTVLLATLNGVVLGSLYLLSRSLLIPAFFHGLQNGMVKGYYAAVAAESGEVLSAGVLWIPMILVTLLTACLLAISAARRTGFLGTFMIPLLSGDVPAADVSSIAPVAAGAEPRKSGATDNLTLTDDSDD